MGAITSIFKKPKTPTPPPPPKVEDQPKVPTVDDARARQEQDSKMSQRKGRLSNFLTPARTGSQLGGEENAPKGLKRFLGS